MILTSVWAKLKEMIKNMTGSKTLEKTLHLSPAISTKMSEAINLWTDMYENKAYWLHEPTTQDPTKIISMGLPSFIASEKARMATIEMKSEITTPMQSLTEHNPDYIPTTVNEDGTMNISDTPEFITTEKALSDTARAEFLNEQYKKVLDKIRTQLEYGIAKGGLVIKPYVILNNSNNDNEDVTTAELEFNFVHADSFFPLAFNANGDITEVAFLEIKFNKDDIYTKIEHHKLEGNRVTVLNRAFKNSNSSPASVSRLDADLGTEISLTEVPEWSSLQPQTIIEPVDRLLFAYFKMPEANTIDVHSPLGVSGFSRAVDLIREADKQYSRMLWEFEGGELAIDIDRDALRTTETSNGERIELLSTMQQRLYRKVDLGAEDTYNVFNPAFRDVSLINGLNNILMRIEDTVGLSRGTLAEVATEARTATELKILKQRSYSANADIQHNLETALKDLVYVMNVYASLYELTPEGEYEVSFEWDDSILTDVDQELSKRITLMQNGLASKIETRMWYFGETEAQAIEALQKVKDETEREMQTNLMNFASGGND